MKNCRGMGKVLPFGFVESLKGRTQLFDDRGAVQAGASSRKRHEISHCFWNSIMKADKIQDMTRESAFRVIIWRKF